MSTVILENTATRFGVQPRREVDAVILSDMGWIDGRFVLPKLNHFVDFLNTATSYVKVTNVSFAGLAQRLPFLALARGAFTLVIPKDDDDRLQAFAPASAIKRHRVSCIFENGWVSGVLESAASLRVSDVLSSAKSFFLLRECTVNVRGSAKLAPVVIVNGARLVGVSEPSIEDVRGVTPVS